MKRYKPIPPDEVLRIAEKAEKLAAASGAARNEQLPMFPEADTLEDPSIKGTIIRARDQLLEARTEEELKEFERDLQRNDLFGKPYCDSCGYVGGHDPLCPVANAVRELAAIEAEERAAEDEVSVPPKDSTEIVPHLRRAVAGLLRRVAKRLEPK